MSERRLCTVILVMLASINHCLHHMIFSFFLSHAFSYDETHFYIIIDCVFLSMPFFVEISNIVFQTLISSVWAHTLLIIRAHSADKNPKRNRNIGSFFSIYDNFTEFLVYCSVLWEKPNQEFPVWEFAQK